MGIFEILKRKNTSKKESKTLDKIGNSPKNTLKEDILIGSDWIVNCLNSSGYKADYTLESMKEIDRFFDEQSGSDGFLEKYDRGQILFGLGSYVGETVIKLYGGKWITDDNDPKGEINISIELNNHSIIWPVIRCLKRYTNGREDSIYDYVYVLKK